MHSWSSPISHAAPLTARRNHQSSAPVAILGGGVSGLAFADAAGLPAVIFEKEDRVGGLCRSFETHGLHHDIGPHIVFSGAQERTDFMRALTPMTRHKRSNQILHRNRFVRYPFENQLSALPASERDWCLDTFLNNPHRELPAENMLAFFLRVFGEGITRTYLEPYNRKIWKLDPVFMDTQMVERIPRPPDEHIVRSAAGENIEGYTHQLHFWYPRAGGIEAMARGLAARCKDRVDVRTQTPVECVEIGSSGEFTVISGRSRAHFPNLVNTIPLHELVPRIRPKAPPDVMGALHRLRYNSIHVTVLNVDEDGLGPHFAIMIPSPDVSIHRVSKLDFLGPAYGIAGTTTLLAETTFHPDEATVSSPEEVSSQVIRSLEHLGLVPAGSVNFCETRTFPYAYVVYDLHHRRNTDRVLAWLDSIGIISLGRFGRFEYINSDAAIAAARAVGATFAGSHGPTATPA